MKILRLTGTIGALLGLLAVLPPAAEADITQELDDLRSQGIWGEIALQDGRVRQIKVDTIDGEQVSLQEVIGALHMRPAIYSLTDIRSVRALGPRRIQPRMAPRTGSASLPLALGLELLIPGAGYFQAGEASQGWRILLASAALGATALTSGEDTAAAWIPLGVWLKTYSLGHLAYEIRATQTLNESRSRLLSVADRTPMMLGVRFRR